MVQGLGKKATRYPPCTVSVESLAFGGYLVVCRAYARLMSVSAFRKARP